MWWGLLTSQRTKSIKSNSGTRNWVRLSKAGHYIVLLLARSLFLKASEPPKVETGCGEPFRVQPYQPFPLTDLGRMSKEVYWQTWFYRQTVIFTYEVIRLMPVPGRWSDDAPKDEGQTALLLHTYTHPSVTLTATSFGSTILLFICLLPTPHSFSVLLQTFLARRGMAWHSASREMALQITFLWWWVEKTSLLCWLQLPLHSWYQVQSQDQGKPADRWKFNGWDMTGRTKMLDLMCGKKIHVEDTKGGDGGRPLFLSGSQLAPDKAYLGKMEDWIHRPARLHRRSDHAS